MSNAAPERRSRARQLLASAARVISLILAASITLVVLLAPWLIASASGHIPHGYLVLTLLGSSCAWMHAFGIRPQALLLRLCFSPPVAWLLLALGIAGIISGE